MSVHELPRDKTFEESKAEYFEHMREHLDDILEGEHLILYAKGDHGIGVSTNLPMSEAFLIFEKYKHAALSRGNSYETQDEDQ